MKPKNICALFFFVTLLLAIGCKTSSAEKSPINSSYSGTASLSKGAAKTTIKNLFPHGQRVAGVGVIEAVDGSTWTVPADVNYTNKQFPVAPDLFNPHGKKYHSAAQALEDFDPSNIVEIDPKGELVTAFIFADNYFELYINGVPVGRDPVPFTQFNSNLVKFRVTKPFTIAMKLVDWEEHLGLGSEKNRGVEFHPGDGGMVAVFKDKQQNVMAITGNNWKAQTFYTSPIRDLNCPFEKGAVRHSSKCNTQGSDAGESFYALHWKVPANWMEPGFNDSKWPHATTYTNSDIGVRNKKSYTNFKDVFDDRDNDAKFIWSTNVILDNEVLVRYTVQ